VGSLSKAFRPVCFVTGASGYVGRALVPELLRAAERVQGRVVAHVRPGSSALEACRQAFEPLGASLDSTPWDPTELTRSLSELAPTHIFHLAGSTHARAKAEGLKLSASATDLELFEHLLHAALQLEVAPRFTYLSSRGAAPRSRSAYLRVRHQCEQRLIASGLPYTIARPGLITGPGRSPSRPGENFAAALLRPLATGFELIGLGGTGALLRPFNAEEAAFGLVHAGFNYTTIGRVLQADELRYAQTKDREWSGPLSRRDGQRY
jgi:uncharacterized protein YbjT (DUF2867 family)